MGEFNQSILKATVIMFIGIWFIGIIWGGHGPSFGFWGGHGYSYGFSGFGSLCGFVSFILLLVHLILNTVSEDMRKVLLVACVLGWVCGILGLLSLWRWRGRITHIFEDDGWGIFPQIIGIVLVFVASYIATKEYEGKS